MVIFDVVIGFIVQLLSTPAVMIGLIALIGLLIQRKPTTDVIRGTIKTIAGFTLIGAGAGVVIAAISPLNVLLSGTFHFTGINPVNESCFAAAVITYGSSLSAIMAGGMIVNLIVARFTKFKFIYLTGHEMMWVATVLAIVLGAAKLPMWQIIIGGALITGTYMAVFPAIIYKSVCKVTGTKDLAVGHTGILFYWVAIALAKLFGDKKKSCEDLNVPKSLNFLRDLTVSLSISMWIMYMIVSLLSMSIDPELATATFAGTNVVIFSLTYAVQFAVAIYIIQAGVRMFVAELVPAFQGVAEKFIPNSVPALDIPILYPYQPNSVLIGFMVAAVGGIVAFLIQVALVGTAFELPVILPTLFIAFFFGATFGALGNVHGGIRGVVIGSFFASMVAQFVPALLIKFGGVLVSGTTFGGSDTALLGIVYGSLSKIINPTGIFICTIIMFLLPFIYSFATRNKPGMTERTKEVE